MTQFEYRQSPQNPCSIEIRHKHTHAGRPSFWRPYMMRESAEAALWLLAMLQEPEQETEAVRE